MRLFNGVPLPRNPKFLSVKGRGSVSEANSGEVAMSSTARSDSSSIGPMSPIRPIPDALASTMHEPAPTTWEVISECFLNGLKVGFFLLAIGGIFLIAALLR